MTYLDQATAIREGEGLDLAKLEPFLKDSLGLAGALEVLQFPSGFSNLTYLLSLGGKDLVLRRPPFGAAIKSAHDMSREYKVLSHLQGVFDKAPQPFLYCDDDAILGAPFYVMERVQGVILRGRMPKEQQPEPVLMRRIANSLVDALVELHRVDLNAAGLSDFGKPESYVERQLKGWTKRYYAAQTDEIPSIDAAAKWLAKNMPKGSSVSLIHNDFKYDNVVLQPDDLTKIIAVLDWEMCTVGDPLLDLGTSLGYWVEVSDPPAMQQLGLSPTALAGNPKRSELVDWYEVKSGREVSNRVFYYVYGLFKVAVIVQQIYTRYKKGLTKDERFAGLIHAVKACGDMADKAISEDQL